MERSAQMNFTLETRILLAMTLIELILVGIALVPESQSERTETAIVCVTGERLYDSTRDRGCAAGGYAISRNATALQPLFTDRSTEERLRVELEEAREAIPMPEEKPMRIEIVILPPPEGEGDSVDDFIGDPVDGVWDAFVWILDKVASALAISP